MKIERTDQTLTIKETPGCLWIFGLFFMPVGGSFVFGALGGYSNYTQLAPWILGIYLLFGLIAVTCGYWIIFKAPVTRLTINRSSETVVLKRRGIAGKVDRTFNFSEIKEFCLIEESDDEGDPIFSLGIDLVSGEEIKLSALQSHDEAFKRNFVFETNQFIYKKMPSYQAQSELEDES
ncbi:MAG: hypothetical protein QM785_16980 [Pyrinomonadaceae bacterium]